AERAEAGEPAGALGLTADGELSLMISAASLGPPLVDDSLAETMFSSTGAGASDDDELDGTLGFAQAIDMQAHAPFPLASPDQRPALALLPLPGAPWCRSDAPSSRADDDPLDGTVGIALPPAGPALPFAGTAEPPPPDPGAA